MRRVDDDEMMLKLEKEPSDSAPPHHAPALRRAVGAVFGADIQHDRLAGAVAQNRHARRDRC